MFVHRDPATVCADSVFRKQPPKTLSARPHSPLLSICGVRKNTVCPLFCPLGGGHQVFPINLSPSQGRRRRRAGGWRCGEGEAEDEGWGTKEGALFGAISLLVCLMKLKAQQAVNDSNYGPDCTPPAAPSLRSLTSSLHFSFVCWTAATKPQSQFRSFVQILNSKQQIRLSPSYKFIQETCECLASI